MVETELKLEVGKQYRTAEFQTGRTTWDYQVVTIVENRGGMFPFVGSNSVSYMADGHCLYDGQESPSHLDDLVKAHIEGE